MHILYIHQYFTVPQHGGGTRSYEMARRMVSNGHQVTMITSSAFLGETWAQKRGWSQHIVEGIRIWVYRLPYSNRMSFFRRKIQFLAFVVAAILKVRHIAGDVVVATSTPLTVAIPGIVAKRRHKIPMVFEVRDLWPELPIAMGAIKNPFVRFFARRLERTAYSSAAAVIALSPGMARGIEKAGVPHYKIKVIPNGCDIELFDRDEWEVAGLKQEYPFLLDGKIVLYAGTFGHINGVTYLVELAKIMANDNSGVRFVLVGDGVDYDKVRRLAKEYELVGKTVWFLPYMSKRRIAALLNIAHASTSLFINLPEMWNNSANKFFDSLAAGCPPVINYGGWQAELLQETGAGVVLPPEDMEDAAMRLKEFLEDEQRQKNARVAAKRLATEQFNRDNLATQFEQVLTNTVHG